MCFVYALTQGVFMKGFGVFLARLLLDEVNWFKRLQQKSHFVRKNKGLPKNVECSHTRHTEVGNVIRG